jgi:hypothetical protein
MVRSRVVILALVPLLATVAGAAPEAAHPFDALLPSVGGAAPGTYVVSGTTLVPTPDSARIPVLLQADVIRGPERSVRVGIVVAADVPEAGAVRLRVSTAAAGKEGARIVADAGNPVTAGPLRLVRGFDLPPGDYELEAIVGDSRPGVGLIALAKSHLTVPDVRGASLTVTPIVVGEAATAPQPSAVPFVFGQTALTPALTPRFPQGGAISVAFRVYNWAAGEGESPDLSVEYLFYEQGKKGLHFFNKVKPQQLNADTLGTAFDPSTGSLATGMMIPLEAFTFGDFQLVVKVTDNRSRQSAEQQVRFTVVL